ncbi:Flavin prenyltransferase UbiX [Trichinella spiralis]|uniref:Flavin prenyltransferase UbiX n=1 Tax=Trichinella spiralis TaxID=6334 RepID=A0ABR3L2H6_TRISP
MERHKLIHTPARATTNAQGPAAYTAKTDVGGRRLDDAPVGAAICRHWRTTPLNKFTYKLVNYFKNFPFTS